MFNPKWLIIAVALVGFGGPPRVFGAEPGSTDFFESQVRPVLAANCFECHGPKKQESDLRLDSREAMMTGNSDGAVIVPGDPEKSRLVKAIRRQGDIKMPPEKTLPDPAVEALATWIKAGALWPEQSPTETASNVAESIAAAAKRHWAFQPVREPPMPSVQDKDRVKSPVDAFVLARLEAVQYPASADRRSPHSDSSGNVRSDRPAADAGRGARLSPRRFARRLRSRRRSAPCLAALRRALGALLARYRPLCRHEGLCIHGGSEICVCLCLSRLGDPSAERRFTVRQVLDRADRRRSPAGQRQWLVGGDGIFDGRPAVPEQSPGHHRRPARRDVSRDDGADGHLRPLPQP